MHAECLFAKHPNKLHGTHVRGSREIVIPIHHLGNEDAPGTREPILDLKGEQWFGPVLPPPDETLLLRTLEAAEQEYGNVWGNTKPYTIVFSKNAWAFKSV